MFLTTSNHRYHIIIYLKVGCLIVFAEIDFRGQTTTAVISIAGNVGTLGQVDKFIQKI